MSYTAPAAPGTAVPIAATATSSTLQPLPEESESGSPIPQIVSPVPQTPPTISFLNGDGYESDQIPTDDAASFNVLTSAPPDGEMMKATMTDVQKAIEQLGRGGVGGEDQRSFSFASTRDGHASESETDFDLSDLEGGTDGADGTEDWHKNARRKLAAKARRAVEEAEKLEAMMAGNGDASSVRRAVAPPIEVELSDESEAEDEGGDFTRSSRFQSMHPDTIQEEEDDAASPPPETKHEPATSPPAEVQVDVPPRDETELPTATAEVTSFPVFTPPPAAVSAPVIEETPPQARPERSGNRPPSPQRSSYSMPVSPPPQVSTSNSSIAPVVESNGTQEPKRNSAPFPVNGMSSPSVSFMGNKHNSIMSSTSAPSMSMPIPHSSVSGSQSLSLQNSLSPVSKTHPSDWTVDQVLEWLKNKGFDQDVCDKFAG